MMLPKRNVQEEMIGEAWTHYKDMIHRIDPNACKDVFTTEGLALFIDNFMVHQSAAYIFCELCTPEQRVYYFYILQELQDESKGYDLI